LKEEKERRGARSYSEVLTEREEPEKARLLQILEKAKELV